MATRFEILLHGENASALRAAGEEALDEIDRLEARLSLFQASSEIAHLNARAARGPVRITPGLFALLQRAKELHEETGGAFDITIAPLVRCWGFMGGSGQKPEAVALAEARAKVGMALVELDRNDFTVCFKAEGVMLDLGAIGKGYAIERAVELLRDAGVTSALLHGGTSTVYGLGRPPEGECWRVAIEDPKARTGSHQVTISASEKEQAGQGSGSAKILATVPLKDEAMSVSAIWGKFFEAEGKTFGHILDPRTGQPADGAVLSAVVLPSATDTDALSTALLIRGVEGHEEIAKLRPGMKTLLVIEFEGRLRLQSKGIDVEPVLLSTRDA